MLRRALFYHRVMPTATRSATSNPTYRIIEKLSKRWTLLILHSFTQKRFLRFSDILEMLPQINSRILSQRLSELEKEGLITRTVSGHKPITIMYAITQKGLDLRRVFDSFAVWGRKWGKKQETKGAFFRTLIGA